MDLKEKLSLLKKYAGKPYRISDGKWGLDTLTDDLGDFWVVVHPKRFKNLAEMLGKEYHPEDTTLDDILSEHNILGFIFQIRGGLEIEEIDMITKDKAKAKKKAEELLVEARGKSSAEKKAALSDEAKEYWFEEVWKRFLNDTSEVYNYAMGLEDEDKVRELAYSYIRDDIDYGEDIPADYDLQELGEYLADAIFSAQEEKERG